MDSNTRWSGVWHVVDVASGKSLESHQTQEAASHAAQIVNLHEVQCGRVVRYGVEQRQSRFPSAAQQ